MANEIYDNYFNKNITIDLSEFVYKHDIALSNIQPAKFTLNNMYSTFLLKDLDLNVISDIVEDVVLLENDRPDLLSTRLYDDPNLWWLPLLINKITPSDFPVNNDVLRSLSETLFNTENRFASISVYYSVLGELNEKHRVIKSIKKDYVTLFIKQLYDFMRRDNVT